jgi:rubrerythrin
MATYICEICGDAYLGEEKPKNCPFCGARDAFIRKGSEANPIVNQDIPVSTRGDHSSTRGGEISDLSKENLKKTYDLEVAAVAIYNCMAGKAKTYEIKAMYKRLAKVEMEHATIVTKLLKTNRPEIGTEACSDEEIENFQKTIELEETAANLYTQFAKDATETNIRILFTALTQVENDHIELIKSYL